MRCLSWYDLPSLSGKASKDDTMTRKAFFIISSSKGGLGAIIQMSSERQEARDI